MVEGKIRAGALLFIAAAAAAAGDETPPRYSVCTDNLREVTPLRTGERFAVVIRLNERGRREFARFSAAHSGKMVEVVVGNRVFVAAILQAAVDSGVIWSGPLATEEAQRWLQRLGTPPPPPCGAFDQ